jgi:hypothetical protein
VLVLILGLAPLSGAATLTSTFVPDADAWVNAAQPTKSNGTTSALKLQGGSQPQNGYLRFTVSGLVGVMTSASLKLWTLSSSSQSIDLHSVASNAWDESTLTYANAPAFSPTITSSSGAFASGTWISFDVSSLVSGNGTYSFALTTANTNVVSVASKDGNGARSPQLVVTTTVTPPSSTSPPAISGSAQDGQTLSASQGSWSGTTPMSFAYQWSRCSSSGTNCAAIAGATGGSYTLTSADVGSTLVVAVTASNPAGSATATSAATGVVAAVPPANAAPPAISGLAQDGQTLSASQGTWSGTTPMSFAYQWSSCDSSGANCIPVAGATATTYKLTSADVGSTLVVAVTATNTVGFATATSAPTAKVAPIVPPSNTSPPAISGLAQDGQTLSASQGTWSGTTPMTFAYQWSDCDSSGANCSPIAGATGSMYKLTSADVGSTVVVAVTASNQAGSATATSAPTLVVAAVAPANVSPPTIAGVAQQGQTLSASQGSWSGTTPISYAYQWQRCSSSGSNCAPIAGATATTYTLTSADVGSTLVVTVTARNAVGSSSANSAASAVVQASSSGDPVVAAAGDVACDPASQYFNGGAGTTNNCHEQATANLLLGLNPTAVLALGDEQYECAGASAFSQSYDPTWGRLKSITHPAVGNHEYQTTGGTGCDTSGKATPYFSYFGAAAGDPTKGYYSFNVGSWHLIALNSNCSNAGGCSAGSPQEVWLKNDLAANPTACTLAFWHHPRWSSDQFLGNNSDTAAEWTDLYNANADVVLSGHAHEYERFAPQNPGEGLDTTRGIREFVVGTGGRSFSTFGSIQPNSEVRNNATFGVLKLTLHATSYDWQFLPEAGKTFTDSGSNSCH